MSPEEDLGDIILCRMNWSEEARQNTYTVIGGEIGRPEL